MRFWYVLALCTLCLTVTITVSAQSSCPPSILLSLARSASTCFNLVRGEACYGNGTASATFVANTSQPFAKSGDIIALETVQTVQTNAIPEDISVVTLYTQANLYDTQQVNIVFMLIGSGEITNLVPYTPLAIVKAIGNAKVRASASEASDILIEIAVNDTLIANGQSADEQWVRVQIPNSTEIGWVSKEVIVSTDNLDILNNNAEDVPFRQPFENLSYIGTQETFCEGQLSSGLFVQATADYNTRFTLNNRLFEPQGTLYITSESIYVLSGSLKLSQDGSTYYIPSGAKMNTETWEITPYEVSETASLPVTILPYRTTVATPLTSDELVSQIQALSIPPTPTQVYITPTPDRTICRYLTQKTTTLYQGPGNFYEANGNLASNTPVFPIYKITESDGTTWYQLDDANWVNVANLYSVGECPEIPTAAAIPAPQYNTIVMETCNTTNGPLREGQFVEIEFTPPAFDSYDAAVLAPRVDPGKILIDAQKLGVTATTPIVFGTATGNRYAVRFYTNWVATSGTHYIETDRLSYELTCQFTVPVGN